MSSVSSITAAVLYGSRDIRVEDRNLWVPLAGYAQVQVVATGLCGSDFHYFTDGRNGEFAVRAPLILGHEAAGFVTALGPGVTNLVVGQRVAIEAGINCRTCDFCVKGRYNLCKGMRFCSSAARLPHVDGTLRTKLNHPAHVLHPLPDSCSFELASLAEPLSVVIHASRRCRLEAGQSVFVFGVGTIGLLACALAKHTGASRVVAVDINPARLAFAKDNGFADDVFCLPIPVPSSAHPHSQAIHDACCVSPSPTSHTPPFPTQSHISSQDEQLKNAKDLASTVLSRFSAPEGFDVVFECTGAESCIQMAIFSATTGGKVMLIGMGARSAYLPVSTAALREIDILGSFRYCDTYPAAVALLAAGAIPTVSKLVTHRFRLEDTGKAFDLMTRGIDEQGGLVLKVMVGTGVAC